jgi:hypothetical protein
MEPVQRAVRGPGKDLQVYIFLEVAFNVGKGEADPAYVIHAHILPCHKGRSLIFCAVFRGSSGLSFSWRPARSAPRTSGPDTVSPPGAIAERYRIGPSPTVWIPACPFQDRSR